ncbi:MAG: deoxycytidine kinase [Bacillales bacterium]|jgi:deoxyadenosine/deoxycytidine kinase|nr:deoxycytidine kinase [Bacillales bacterium]
MNLREKYEIPSNAIITITGTVGVGKSTLTNALATALGFRTSFENVETNPYLDLFYNDFERWSFHLQVFFLAERFKEQKRMFEYGGGFIQDRSIYEDTEIFAKRHFEKGTMTKVDYETYSRLFKAMMLTPYFPKPDLLIHLEGPLEDILGRVKLRGREMEQRTPIEYWEEMYNRYNDWIDNFNDCPVMRLGMHDYCPKNHDDSIEKIIARISSYLKLVQKK